MPRSTPSGRAQSQLSASLQGGGGERSGMAQFGSADMGGGAHGAGGGWGRRARGEPACCRLLPSFWPSVPFVLAQREYLECISFVLAQNGPFLIGKGLFFNIKKNRERGRMK